MIVLPDGPAKDRAGGQHHQLRPRAGRLGNGVGGDDLPDLRHGLQPLQSAMQKHPVGADDIDLLQAVVEQQAGEFDDGAAGGDLVVVDDRSPEAGHLTADEAAVLHAGVGDAGLVGRGEAQVEHLGKARRRLGAAHVGGHDDGVLRAEAVIAEVVGKQPARRQRVGRDAEEAVHLRRVERHGHDAGRPRRGQQVGYQPGGDGDARGVLLVGAGVGEVGDDGVDLAGGGALGDVEHHQQFHEVIAHRRHEGLDDVDRAAADAGSQLDEQIIVAEPREVGLLQFDAQALGDGRRQARVGTTAEQSYFALIKGLEYVHGIYLVGR